jgi:hypothetical protein
VSIRGKIRNPEYSSQIFRFEGMRWESITPTDIDCFVEFGDRLFCFVEAKYKNSELSRGQKLALERTVSALESTGRIAIIFKATHSERVGEIDMGSCEITEYFMRGEWKPPPKGLTVKEGIDRLRRIFIGVS